MASIRSGVSIERLGFRRTMAEMTREL